MAPSSNSKGLHELWTLLRVTMLQRIWLVRQAGSPSDPGVATSFTSTRLVASFVAEVSTLVQHYWLRVQGDIRSNSGVCPT
jgi:hypothetical protein